MEILDYRGQSVMNGVGGRVEEGEEREGSHSLIVRLKEPDATHAWWGDAVRARM